MSIRSHAGHSIKSSLRHSLEIDERDNPFLPSSGFIVKATQELAGIGGDVFFGKSEVQGTYYQPLPAGWVRGRGTLTQRQLFRSVSCYSLFGSLCVVKPVSLNEVWGIVYIRAES